MTSIIKLLTPPLLNVDPLFIPRWYGHGFCPSVPSQPKAKSQRKKAGGRTNGHGARWKGGWSDVNGGWPERWQEMMAGRQERGKIRAWVFLWQVTKKCSSLIISCRPSFATDQRPASRAHSLIRQTLRQIMKSERASIFFFFLFYFIFFFRLLSHGQLFIRGN